MRSKAFPYGNGAQASSHIEAVCISLSWRIKWPSFRLRQSSFRNYGRLDRVSSLAPSQICSVPKGTVQAGFLNTAVVCPTNEARFGTVRIGRLLYDVSRVFEFGHDNWQTREGGGSTIYLLLQQYQLYLGDKEVPDLQRLWPTSSSLYCIPDVQDEPFFRHAQSIY